MSGEQRLSQRSERRPRHGLVSKAGALGVGVLVVAGGMKLDIIPDIGIGGLFHGGKSDPAPRGKVIYEGQKAETASAKFLIEVGKGTAYVSVKANQDYDEPGGILSGDWMPTNSTMTVSDPKNGDMPATLEVETRYCSNGTIEKTTTTDKKTGLSSRKVIFNVGEISVCGANFANNDNNNGAFNQDSAPRKGVWDVFQTFVKGATTTEAMAAPCPTKELEKYTSPAFNSYAQTVIAGSMGIPAGDVTIIAGTIGHTDNTTKRLLASTIDSYANKKDPHNPKKTYPSLDMEFIGTGGRAIEDSCYNDIGAVKLSDINQFNPNNLSYTK